MAAYSFGSYICCWRTSSTLDSPSVMFFPLCISRSTLAGHHPHFSIPRAQRVTPPLTLDHAQRLQRVGLRLLQCRCLCNSSWYVLGLHSLISRSYLIRTAPFALGQSTLTIRNMISFAINALIILSTIHAQDFRDEVGDKLMGRRTIPIVWPEGSRIGILLMLTGWSIGLSWACGLAFLFSVPFCAWAAFIGLRFFRKRTSEEDQRSYRYYNVRFFT
jgi:hypothetical protein